MLALCFIWGSSFILIKKGLIGLSSYELVAFRLFFSFLFFIPFIVKIDKENFKKNWKVLSLMGVTGSAFPFLMYAIAQTRVESSIAGILNALVPIFTFVIGISIFSKKFSINKFIGVSIGLLGAIILIYYSSGFQLEGASYYSFFIVAATISNALNVNLVEKYGKDLSPISLSASSFVLIGIGSFLFLVLQGIFFTVFENKESIISLGYVSILSFFGTFLATILFFNLVKITNALVTSMVAYLIPFVALFWGYFDAEIIGVEHFISLFLILLGVFLSKRK